MLPSSCDDCERICPQHAQRSYLVAILDHRHFRGGRCFPSTRHNDQLPLHIPIALLLATAQAFERVDHIYNSSSVISDYSNISSHMQVASRLAAEKSFLGPHIRTRGKRNELSRYALCLWQQFQCWLHTLAFRFVTRGCRTSC